VDGQQSWPVARRLVASARALMEQGQNLVRSLLLHPNHLRLPVRASAAVVAAARAVTAGIICSVARAIKCAWIDRQSPPLVQTATYARTEESQLPHPRHLVQPSLHLLVRRLAISSSLGGLQQSLIAAFGKMWGAIRSTGSVDPEHRQEGQVLIRLRLAHTFSSLRLPAE